MVQHALSGILSVVIVTLGADRAAAQEVPPPPPPETEAARLYREALDEWREIQRTIPDISVSDLWYLQGNPERVDPTEARPFIAQLQPLMQKLRQAQRAGHPQWPITYTDGWNTRLPHVMQVRSLLTMAMMDLDWRMHTGATNGVGADLGMVFEMGQTLRDDRMIISSLVEVAAFALGSTILDHALGSGTLSQQDAKSLLETIDQSASGEGFFGLAEAFENENHHSTEWMLGLLDQEDGIRQLQERLLQFQPFNTKVDATLLLSDMTSEDLETAIHLQSVAMTRASEILRMDDLDLAQQEFQRLSDDVKAGVYGPIAEVSGALSSNIMKAAVQIAEHLNRDRERLEIVAAGPEGAKGLRNAAIWYRRAIAEWNRLPEEVRTAILHRDEETESTRDEMRAALQKAQPIVDIILEASDIERCAFDDSMQRRFYLWPATRDYLSGMRDLGVLVERAAANAISQNEVESASALCKAGIVMCDHLAQDQLFGSSDAARAIFDSMAPHLGTLIDDNSGGVHPIMREAIDRLDANDHFGYRAAIRDVAARVRYILVVRSGGKDMFAQEVEYGPNRTEGVSQEAVTGVAGEIKVIREEQWPVVRKTLADLIATSVVALAAAQTAEEIDAAEGTLREQLASPDATMIRAVAELFLTPVVEAARAAIEADEAVSVLRDELAAVPASDAGQ